MMDLYTQVKICYMYEIKSLFLSRPIFTQKTDATALQNNWLFLSSYGNCSSNFNLSAIPVFEITRSVAIT